MNQSIVVHCDPDILGGTAVLVGTRVPVKALLDYIAGGHTLNDSTWTDSLGVSLASFAKPTDLHLVHESLDLRLPPALIGPLAIL